MKHARLIALIASFVVSGGAVYAQGIPPATLLVYFEVQPSDTEVGVAMDPAVTVRVMGGVDAPLPAVAVQLQLAPNPYNCQLTLEGYTGVDGRVRFFNLVFDRPGVNLSFRALATVSGFQQAIASSDPFNVTGAGPSVVAIGPLTTAIYTLRLPANTCHPSPTIPYCADEWGDTMPAGPELYYMFGFFDTGSSVVFINNSAPSPYASDANVLNLCSASGDCPEPPGDLLPNLDMRVWGLEAVNPDPNNPGAPLDTPEAEVFGLRVRPHGGPTLIGAPIASEVVADINYLKTVSRDYSWGTITSPDIEFFPPDDASIPSPLFEVELKRHGSSGTALDGSSTGPRYLAMRAAFEKDGLTADDSSFGFLVDTANTTTQINENVAAALGIDTASDPPYDTQVINTLQGELTVKGYVVDSFGLKSVDETRRFLLYNPLVYVVPPRAPPNDLPEQTFFAGIDVILGSNYFAHTRILFDGPRDRLGLFWGVPVDEDDDGVADVNDNCPSITNPGQEDGDEDGFGDVCDNCPEDNNPTQADRDDDGVGNVCDNCSYESNPDQANSDGDGWGDACDSCPDIFEDFKVDSDGDGIADVCDPDIDGDGLPNEEDNCPGWENPDQTDTDGDSMGDACDVDDDGDGVLDTEDNCPLTPNPGQTENDGDGIGDACDPCPFDSLNDIDGDGVCGDTDNCPNDANADQDDNEGDGVGDVCDPDDDNDGIDDGADSCPLEPNPDNLDGDGDLIGDVCDPCPANPLNDVCDPDNSAGESIGSEGGSVTTPNGNVTIVIPEAALDTDTSISVTDSGEGTNFMLMADIGGGSAFFQVTINPEGTVFNVPVTITLGWPDADGDGLIDGLDPVVDELDLQILKDGVAITGECRDDFRCDPVLNTFSVEVTGLSDFALFVLDCPEMQVPEDQSYWQRQCKGFETDRFKPTEPDFADELVPCADEWLDNLDFSSTDTCDGMDADPANDDCEKALKKLTAMILNVCSDRLGAGCLVDTAETDCSAPTVGILMDEISEMIHDGNCKEAKICASVVD